MKWTGRQSRKRRPQSEGRHGSALDATEPVGQIAHEEADIGDDAESLVAAPVGQLGHDGLVDVDAVRLHPGGQEIAGGDGVQGGGQHQGHVDVVEQGSAWRRRRPPCR